MGEAAAGEVVKAARDDPKALLKLCDELRDDVLPFAGIRLEDTSSGTVWKLARKEDLIAEREEKMRVAKEKEEMKKKMAEEKARKEKEKEETVDVSSTMAKLEVCADSRFDT